jgi:hypothetical protein
MLLIHHVSKCHLVTQWVKHFVINARNFIFRSVSLNKWNGMDHPEESQKWFDLWLLQGVKNSWEVVDRF